nr:MAG TPA: hypothetical protein [Siphoviridae sp. ctHdl3]DAV61871.1 MAG TPA: hypothetical protein [Caudoviricetes sp.]
MLKKTTSTYLILLDKGRIKGILIWHVFEKVFLLALITEKLCYS